MRAVFVYSQVFAFRVLFFFAPASARRRPGVSGRKNHVEASGSFCFSCQFLRAVAGGLPAGTTAQSELEILSFMSASAQRRLGVSCGNVNVSVSLGDHVSVGTISRVSVSVNE